MSLASFDIVQEIFRDYYQRDYSLTFPVSMINEREFGFLLFEGKMLRHKSFQNNSELQSFLQDCAPSDAYYSCAYYKDPEAEMDNKGWLGADLIFDIDADHIPTSCNKIHDTWVCVGCNFGGRGITPEKCPVCGGQKFDVKSWLCEACLDSAKAEAIKLLEMLVQDFGFSNEEVQVFFSGHRGYHVHVESKAIMSLDAVSRKEVVDYVSGLGFDWAFHGFSEKSWSATRVSKQPSLHDFGWRGRIAKGMHDFIFNAKEEDFSRIGLNKNVTRALIKNKDLILKNLENVSPLGATKGVGFGTWKKIMEFCAKEYSANVDTVVTTDIHRLVRLTETLHGKTGLKKVEFPVSAIEDFDPFKSAVAFKTGTLVVFVSEVPKFRLGDEIFGPYKEQRVELPTAAAVLLVCKNRAKVVR